METTNPTTPAPAASPMSPLAGLGVVALVIVLIVAFVMLTNALGTKDAWVGFLFLTYWAGKEQMDFKVLPATACGALIGTVMAYLLQLLPHQMGTTGLLIAIGVVLVALYCQIMGWLPVAINVVTMLFLTAGTVPHIQATANFIEVFYALILGIIFFPGLVWIGSKIGSKQEAS